jgi:hypothetical protein
MKTWLNPFVGKKTLNGQKIKSNLSKRIIFKDQNIKVKKLDFWRSDEALS